MLERWFKADTLEIDREDAIDPKCFNWHTPIKLTQIDIWTRQSQYWQRPGIVLGNVSDFDDILLFWNMRAASTPLLFYDITQSQRLRPSIDAFIDLLQENDLDEGRPALNIWSHKDSTEHDLDLGGVPATHYVTSAATTWSDLSVKLPKPRFTKWGIDVVPAYLHNDKTRSVTFSLPQTPFYNDDNHALRQRFVVTVNISQYGEFADQLTFNTPPWPELNEFYGRNFYFDYSAARVEIDELDRSVVGIITDVTSQQQTIYAMRVQSLLKELFRHLRIEIKPSQPGLVCSRLIAQLGGTQGCRVLKVRGARELIRKYGPEKSFTRSGALQIIGDFDQETKKPHFSDFETLYIEARDSPKLKPDDVLRYLVSKGVFRVGLELKCDSCLLESWIHIDDLQTVSRCDYCGHEFDITPQLKDRDWRYRRSGLFGREGEQQGSVPVAVTIQQLETVLHDRALMYSTALKFRSSAELIEECEADFVALVAGYPRESPVQVLFGECKTSGPIEEDDARKLGRLADAVSNDLGDAYVMFAKTSTFSPEELEIAKTLNSDYTQRVILWSRDELEPYFVYERSKEKLGHRAYGAGLSDLAEATAELFFAAP